MVALVRFRGLGGGHLFFGARHFGIWGVLVVLAVIIVVMVLSNRTR